MARDAAQSSSARTPRTIAAWRVGATRGSSRGSLQSEPPQRLRAVARPTEAAGTTKRGLPNTEIRARISEP